MAGSIRRIVDRLLTGPAPSDPLYLSNRTWKQKLRVGLLVSFPLLAVVGTASYIILAPPTPAHNPPPSLTDAEIAARTAIVPDKITVVQNTDLQVVEVSVDRGAGTHVLGTLKNNTGRHFSAAELAFDLADESGAQIGRASTRVAAIQPHGAIAFRFSIPQKNATLVVVREVRPFY